MHYIYQFCQELWNSALQQSIGWELYSMGFTNLLPPSFDHSNTIHLPTQLLPFCKKLLPLLHSFLSALLLHSLVHHGAQPLFSLLSSSKEEPSCASLSAPAHLSCCWNSAVNSSTNTENAMATGQQILCCGLPYTRKEIYNLVLNFIFICWYCAVKLWIGSDSFTLVRKLKLCLIQQTPIEEF